MADDSDPKKPHESNPQKMSEEELDNLHHLDAERRRFLNQVTIGLGAVGGGVVGVPIAGFVVAPMLEETQGSWQTVGKVVDFAVGSTTLVKYEDPSPLAWAGVTAKTAAWLRRVGDEEFIAFSVNCTHLGCPVRYLDGAGLFMCPCHGGVYYDDGEPAAGPPPRELPRYPVRVAGDEVQIMTTPLPATVAPA